MSSFVGHGLVGVALGARMSWRWRLGVVFFACLPDIEYLPYWFLGIELQPRWTHSIGFVIAVWFLAIAVLRILKITPPARFEVIIALAGLSHVLMDYLVGIHANPIFAPLTTEVFLSPIGVLPSAGALNPTNPYLWRNLLIELGILAPLLWLGWKILQGQGTVSRVVITLAAIMPFLLWSLSLSR